MFFKNNKRKAPALQTWSADQLENGRKLVVGDEMIEAYFDEETVEIWVDCAYKVEAEIGSTGFHTARVGVINRDRLHPAPWV